ncbi:MAG: hypothetical protein JO102_06195 [Elusimicrobia bacterium]|nr:hypothetical protein [Elusimicrobiota bacterium]
MLSPSPKKAALASALLLLLAAAAPFARADDDKDEKHSYDPAIAYRPVRFFANVDLFAVNDADKNWKKSLQNTIDTLGTTLGATSGEINSYGAVGVRAGVLRITESGWEAGGSLGYISGPSAEANIDTTISGVGTLHTEDKFEAAFTRLLAEARKSARVSRRVSLRLGVGAGIAWGRLKQTTDLSGTSSSSNNMTEKWHGFTGEISPAIIFDINPVSVEFGLRYVHMPRKAKSDNFDSFKWNPFGVFAGLMF